MKRVLILTAFLMAAYFAEAQIVVAGDSTFKYRIKLVESFMERFNSGESIVPLFDQMMLGSGTSAEEFSKSALKSGAKLHFSDTSWFAVAPCTGKFKGKSVDFVLILNVENYGKDLYKWVVAKAQGEIFKLTPSDKSAMVTPLAHETNFMELSRINAGSVLNISQKNYRLDETAVFFAFYNSGLLTIEYVSDLQFMFLQVPGYVFMVKEFDRQYKNSGWLINSVTKMSEIEKNKLLKDLYNEK